MNYNIYIIIVTYNAMKWAEKCFSSLRKSSISVKTIVVDNGSTDGTQEYIKTNFPEVNFIQSPQNLGFGKANNIGIEIAYKAGADFFYLMNQDAWIFEDSFEKMLEVYDSYPNKEEIGIISPMHLDGSEEKLDPHFERYLARGNEFNNFISDLYLNKLLPNYEIPFVNAAHWMLTRQIVEIVGGFNPYFFHGAEDYDYVNRIKYHSFKIQVATNSRVVHDAQKQTAETDAIKALHIRRISARMQLETKYLDPSFPFSKNREKRAFLTSLVKHMILRNSSERQNIKQNLDYFEKKFTEIENLRKKLTTEPHVFLNF